MPDKKHLNKKPLFELAHTRVKAQKDRMEECTKLGICPFCWENLKKWHDAPVIKKGKFWVITANDHPYTGSKHHYLAIAKEHVGSISELSSQAAAELIKLFAKFCKEKNIPGATIVMRTGDMSYTGATVFHLHAHIISGGSRKEISDPKYPEDFIISAVGYKVQ